MKVCILFLSLFLTMPIQSKQSEPYANCCLCSCHAKDETKCSAMCIRLQHGKKIVELSEMNKCTKECKRVHVVTVKP
jgi:hypothetical protein